MQREQRYHVTAGIGIRAPPGLEFEIEDLELVKAGSFHDAEGPLEVELGGTMGELRKLALASDELHAFVAEADAHPDAAPAVLKLRARPTLLKELADACATIPGEPTADQLVESESWLAAALKFGEYEPRELALVEGLPQWRA